jgi:hypothetical protein
MTTTRPDATAKRADPFDMDAEPNVSAFAPTPARKPPIEREKIRQVSEQANFPSRAPVIPQTVPPATPQRKEQRRHRTGRNVQLSIKARRETVDRFTALADRYGWVMGETLDKALDALEAQLARQRE